MKIVSSKQMAHLEELSISQGFDVETFMENAGCEIAKKIIALSSEKEATLLIGKGNNGGDAYVAGRELLKAGWKVHAVQPTEDLSALSKKNSQHFLKAGGKLAKTLPKSGIIIDGLFGTGFHGKPKEPFSSLIDQANACGQPIFSIDLPSGLNGDTGTYDKHVIHAKHTFFLGLPKKGFFLQEGWNVVGKLHAIDFGLPQTIITKVEKDMTLLRMEDLYALLPPMAANRHKYQAGVVTALAGCLSMPGASLLATTGALRTGAGLVKLLYLKEMEEVLSNSPYELIKIPYKEVNEVIDHLNASHAALIGPGLGKEPTTRTLLKKVLPEINIPAVIDADGLTIAAQEKISFPKNAILTPHVGEMARLLSHLSPKPHTTEFLHTCQHYVEKHQVTLVLKGGPTFIFHPDKPITVSPFGDPGMATGGTGDVLTGVIAALLAQKCSSHDAAQLAVGLHGLAGEKAAEKLSSYSMVASDLFWGLSEAFQDICSKR